MSWWSLAVDFEDESVDDLYAIASSDRIAVVPDRQEDVSIALAAGYVSMCADLLTERDWWVMLRAEQHRNTEAARMRRRERWRARLRYRK